LLFDLQGPKLRLSAGITPRVVQAGEIVTFFGGAAAASDDRIAVDFADFPRLVSERSEIVIGDGVPRLVVESTGPGEVVARALSTGELAPRKGINVTYARPELPAITEKDLRDLALAAELGADFVALSFVRSAADIEQLRALLEARGWRGRTVAKIEKVEAYDHLDEIIAAADGVMVARGDYGVEAGVAHVPLMQKDTIYRATQAGKLVITAKTAEMTREKLVRHMVGRDITQTHYAHKEGHAERRRQRREKVLTVENVTMGTMVKNMSFSVYAGEVVGIAGLIGSGRTEIAKIIFGALKRNLINGGTIKLRGRPIRYRVPKSAEADSGRPSRLRRGALARAAR